MQTVEQQIKTLEKKVRELKEHIQEHEKGIQADQIIRSIAVNSPSNIMLLDMDAHIKYINRTVPGITPEEMLGLNLIEIVEEQFKPGICGALERVAKTGKPDRYETSYTSPSGDFSWWDSSVGPVIQDSKVTGYVVVSTNTTEQRRKHEEQESFFNLSVDMMCVGNFDGFFLRVNQSFKTTLGYEQELLQRPILEFIHPDDVKATEQVFSRLIKGDILKGYSNRFRASDGNYRSLSWQAIVDPKREVIYAAARDVTDTKNLEEQLQQSRKIEAVGQLAGGIAHDFNNLLSVIQGNIELAQENPELSKSSLHSAMEATNRAATLTQQLLIFSRNKTLSLEVIELEPILDNLMDMLKRLLPENISINLQHSKGNVSAILADKSQIEQMTLNLCVNARDAMPDGGVLTLAIKKVQLKKETDHSSHVSPGEYLEFSVTDTGRGMTPKVKMRIFEPFYTTKEVGKGTGLGLSTVYGIVQKHGGTIKVSSHVGHGSTFRVFLPTTAREHSEKVNSKSQATPAKGGNETILVAEDDPMVRNTVTRILIQAGYNVISAVDGQDAVQQFQSNSEQVSLALLDIVMPNLGGLDAAEQLSSQCPGLNIIFTSGYLQNSQDPKRLETEIFLTKPYHKDSLLKSIRQALDSTA
jgi:PAS domain S-box-containing protein